MYFEKQQGGNCRIHSINTLLGKQTITPSSLQEYATKFDTEYFLTEPSNCSEFDRVESNGLMLVSYIIEQETNLCAFCSPIGTSGFHEQEILESKLYFPAIMVFNTGHIWTFKQDEHKQWWNLDSLQSGPSQISEQAILKRIKQTKHGCVFYIPQEHVQTCLMSIIQKEVVNYFQKKSIQNEDDILQWIQTQCDEHTLLGDLEIWIFRYVHLKTRMKEMDLEIETYMNQQYTTIAQNTELFIQHLLIHIQQCIDI